MLRYVARRVLLMIPTLIAISFVVFVIIQLPEGDYLDSMVAEMQARGERLPADQLAFLREQYGLDQPFLQRYVNWISDIVLRGNFGYSFEYDRPVLDIIGDRFWLTAILAAGTIMFTWIVAFLPCTNIVLATTFSRSSAFSAWQRPISCWRSFSCISHRYILVPRSAP